MTNLTFFAGTRSDRHPTRTRGYIARARENCHLVFAIGLFKGVTGSALGLWKSPPGVNQREILSIDGLDGRSRQLVTRWRSPLPSRPEA